jgi:hypothetical protein
MNSRFRKLTLGVSFLLLAALACNLPVGQQIAVTEIVDTLVGGDNPPAAPQAPIASVVPASQIPAAPQAPAASAVPVAPQPVSQYPANLLKNPGFEDGFNDWSENPDAFKYGGQSVDENVVAHSGEHSRKLFLRYGGSDILQRVTVNPPLPMGSSIILNFWFKMPDAGSKTNKCFDLKMTYGNDAGQQETAITSDICEAFSDWDETALSNSSTDIQVTWIEVHAVTTKGDGTDKNFDKPVYVDDFTLTVSPPP